MYLPYLKVEISEIILVLRCPLLFVVRSNAPLASSIQPREQLFVHYLYLPLILYPCFALSTLQIKSSFLLFLFKYKLGEPYCVSGIPKQIHNLRFIRRTRLAKIKFVNRRLLSRRKKFDISGCLRQDIMYIFAFLCEH